jgi:hypothetical protein
LSTKTKIHTSCCTNFQNFRVKVKKCEGIGGLYGISKHAIKAMGALSGALITSLNIRNEGPIASFIFLFELMWLVILSKYYELYMFFSL